MKNQLRNISYFRRIYRTLDGTVSDKALSTLKACKSALLKTDDFLIFPDLKRIKVNYMVGDSCFTFFILPDGQFSRKTAKDELGELLRSR